MSGTPRPDGDENSEVLWLDCSEALEREDVPGLTKSMIRCALAVGGLGALPYKGSNPPCSLYGIE